MWTVLRGEGGQTFRLRDESPVAAMLALNAVGMRAPRGLERLDWTSPPATTPHGATPPPDAVAFLFYSTFFPGTVSKSGRPTEKGHLTLELLAEGQRGHAAVPPRETCVGILARAIRRLEQRPFAARLREPVRSVLDELGCEMALARWVTLANLWLFGSLIARPTTRKPLT